MKYGKNSNDKNAVTARFKLMGAEPRTAKNGTTRLMSVFLKDADGKPVTMTGFETDWNTSLWNGLDFDNMNEGDPVEVTYVKKDNFYNFKSIAMPAPAQCDGLPF